MESKCHRWFRAEVPPSVPQSLCGSEMAHKAAGLGYARYQIAASHAIWGEPNSIPP